MPQATDRTGAACSWIARHRILWCPFTLQAWQILRWTGQHRLARISLAAKKKQTWEFWETLVDRNEYKHEYFAAWHLAEIDAVIGPTLPLPAFRHGDRCVVLCVMPCRRVGFCMLCAVVLASFTCASPLLVCSVSFSQCGNDARCEQHDDVQPDAHAGGRVPGHSRLVG